MCTMYWHRNMRIDFLDVISSLYILLFQILLIRIEVCVQKDITGEFQL